MVVLVLGATVALVLNARFISGDDETPPQPAATSSSAPTETATSTSGPRRLPAEIRGVHVTMPLTTIDGKLDEYIALADEGMTAIQLDVKDENGEIGLSSPNVPLARKVGAVQGYYNGSAVARRVHDAGLYLIGRIVVFEDPRLAAGSPELAIQSRGGGIWTNSQGLGWTNPYDERVWEYNVDIAVAAARAGFDEIMFDYLRFPSDGDLADIVYPGRTDEPKWRVIADFAEYARERLEPLGVRVSAAVFGLAATRDLGIGQRPRALAQHLDTIYPMVYPSHYGSGEYNLADPSGQPGVTVSYSLLDFKRELDGTTTRIVPWLQDFYGYTLEQVALQVDAARRARTAGYLLWNPNSVYTAGALAAR